MQIWIFLCKHLLRSVVTLVCCVEICAVYDHSIIFQPMAAHVAAQSVSHILTVGPLIYRDARHIVIRSETFRYIRDQNKLRTAVCDFSECIRRHFIICRYGDQNIRFQDSQTLQLPALKLRIKWASVMAIIEIPILSKISLIPF